MASEELVGILSFPSGTAAACKRSPTPADGKELVLPLLRFGSGSLGGSSEDEVSTLLMEAKRVGPLKGALVFEANLQGCAGSSSPEEEVFKRWEAGGLGAKSDSTGEVTKNMKHKWASCKSGAKDSNCRRHSSTTDNCLANLM